jgi:plasmid replication initiation protein
VLQENQKDQLMVVKANSLVEASYRLDLMEQRLILAAIGEGREADTLLNAETITITAKDFLSMFPDVQEKDVYSQLKAARKRLFGRYVTIRDIHPETGLPRVNEVRWLSSSSYIDGAGMIQIRFAPEIVPYIARLSKSESYTKYRIEKIGRMTSAHAIRLYELLAQYLAAGRRELKLTELKQMLGIAGEYGAIKDFKKRVLEPATQQINEFSDIEVTYTQRKTGVAVTHLIFDIKAKAEAKTKPSTPKKASKRPTVDREYVERHARPGESYDQAYRRLLEDAGQQALPLESEPKCEGEQSCLKPARKVLQQGLTYMDWKCSNCGGSGRSTWD